MSKQSTATLKSYFNTGDTPSEPNFADFIDSVLNLEADTWDIDVTGFTDSTAKLQAIFDAASDGDTVYLPKGIIYLITTVSITKQIRIIGQGTKIKLNHPIKAFSIDSDYVTIENVHFERFSGTKDANQYGIYVNNKNNFKINRCTFINLYHGIYFGSTKLTGAFATSSITDSFFQVLTYGILGGSEGEYVNISGCRGYNNTNHIEFEGGNINITSCMLTLGTNGINVLTGLNDGHGIINGCEINHLTGNALFFDSIVKGMTLSAVHVFGGDIYLKDCAGVSLINCMLDVINFNFENASGSVFSNNRHLTGFTNIVDKSFNGAPASTVIANNNYLLDGTVYTGL